MVGLRPTITPRLPCFENSLQQSLQTASGRLCKRRDLWFNVGMDPELAQRLNEINRAFYTRFAAEFAGSRSLAQPSLQRVLAYVPPAGRVLDVGCGNGRMAHLLAQRLPGGCYLGLDLSAELIRQAREAAAAAGLPAEFAVADVLQPGWSAALAGRAFDTVLLLAVLHHLPGRENRLALLRNLGELLAPAGQLILSAWQFTSNARMRRKIVPWERVGFAKRPAGLEPGDYLLDWKRGGLGYRYCHLIGGDELSELAAGSGLRLLETFRADGKEGDLSLFGVLRPA